MADEDVWESLRAGQLAVVVGAGGYAQQLVQEIRARGVSPIVYTWVPFHPTGRWVQPADLREFGLILQEDGVTDIVHAGTFSFAHLLFAGAQAFARPVGLSQILLAARGVRRGFFAPYAENLREVGVRARVAGELFDRYRPVPGAMGRTAPAAGEAPRLAALKSLALNGLQRADPFLRVAQAVIFDGDEPVHWERTGTDNLCRMARRSPTASARRTLVKVLPDGLPPKLDPPTIGTHTVVEAKAAGVDVIALDAEHGLVIDREATARAADEAGILLFGI